MDGNDQYEDLREMYDSLVGDIVPKLTSENVGVAIEAVNTIVRLQRPADWTFSEEPREILGITSDGKMIAYGEGTRLGFYHARPLEEVYSDVEKMVVVARKEYETEKDNPDSDTFCRDAVAIRLQHAKNLLDKVGLLQRMNTKKRTI